MTRNRVMIGASLGLAALLLGCGFTQTQEEGAVTKTADREIPGTHSPNDINPVTAEMWIDEVRVGRQLDVNDSVPKNAVTDTFASDEPIHVSMEVTDAPAGSMVLLRVPRLEPARRSRPGGRPRTPAPSWRPGRP